MFLTICLTADTTNTQTFQARRCDICGVIYNNFLIILGTSSFALDFYVAILSTETLHSGTLSKSCARKCFFFKTFFSFGKLCSVGSAYFLDCVCTSYCGKGWPPLNRCAAGPEQQLFRDQRCTCVLVS